MLTQTFEDSFSGPGALLGSLDTNSTICHNASLIRKCDVIHVGGLQINGPSLLPCCLGALIIGLTLAKKAKGMQTKNSIPYAITFAMVGFMMTDAGWYDCILPNIWKDDKLIHDFYGIIDVGLTSSIGYAFLILGLLDVGILCEKSRWSWGIWGAGTAAIFYGWIQTFAGNWKAGFLVLYMGVVAIGCGSWTVIQLVLVLGHRDWKSLKWLLFAGAHGGFGFFSLLSSRINSWLCNHFGCHFASSFVWFLVTDTAIYFIYRFYVSRIDFEKKAKLKEERESLAYHPLN